MAQKIGFRGAVDLARDARITALEKLLVEKNVATKEEVMGARNKEEAMIEVSVATMPMQTNSPL